MPRLQNISKYCVSRRSSSVAPSNEYAMLTPSIGLWATPLTVVGCGSPAASSTVGATSITWWNCVRNSPRAANPFGQCTIVPLRVPPQCEATFGPLIGGVHRVRPAHRVVVVRAGRAELFDPRGHEIGRLQRCRTVEHEVLVERA